MGSLATQGSWLTWPKKVHYNRAGLASGPAAPGGEGGREGERSQFRAAASPRCAPGWKRLRDGQGTRSGPGKPRMAAGRGDTSREVEGWWLRHRRGGSCLCLSVCPSLGRAQHGKDTPDVRKAIAWKVVMSAESYKSKPRMSSMCVRTPKDLTLTPSLNYLTESGLTCLSPEHYSRGSGRRRCRWIQDSFGANTSASWTGRSWGLIMGRGRSGGVSSFPVCLSLRDPAASNSCPLQPRWASSPPSHSPPIPQIQQPNSTYG